MFLIRFAYFHHGSQALQIAGISPWILTVSETGQRAFFHDLFHESILGDMMLLEKEEEVRGRWSVVSGEDYEEAAFHRQGLLS